VAKATQPELRQLYAVWRKGVDNPTNFECFEQGFRLAEGIVPEHCPECKSPHPKRINVANCTCDLFNGESHKFSCWCDHPYHKEKFTTT
jgi:hypothetical protein